MAQLDVCGVCNGDDTSCAGECDVSNPDYVGDGWCDFTEYNTAACGWDGGDCCSGTCTPDRQYACGSGGYECFNPSEAAALGGKSNMVAEALITDGKPTSSATVEWWEELVDDPIGFVSEPDNLMWVIIAAVVFVILFVMTPVICVKKGWCCCCCCCKKKTEDDASARTAVELDIFDIVLPSDSPKHKPMKTSSQYDAVRPAKKKMPPLNKPHVAVEEPLHPAWSEAKDPATGESYYYHKKTKKTTWTRPTRLNHDSLINSI
jgi:hypothetical protein